MDTDAPGLYLHVPFCKTKCPYCDFYSTTSGAAIPRWLACLRREMELYTGTFSCFDTVYLGGGTPSLLSEKEISFIVNRLAGAFHIADDSEITIEANPDDITQRKLAAYKDFGINRISLGVQSFCDSELRYLGRRHDAEQALRAIQQVRDAGFDNLGIDLICGFEGQSLAGWKRTLRRALDLSPEHLSCYQMTIEPDAPFGRMRASGAVREICEEKLRRFFLETAELLRANGYVHYEISNFARSEKHIARHNSKYWRHAPYLGLGPAAHSFKDNKRWWNVRSVAGYCRALENGTAPLAGSEKLTPEQIALETISLGFRTRGGVDLSTVSGNPGAKRALSILQRESLIEIACGRAAPTLSGFLVSDEIPLLFF
jgi:putative oxygen-independent coproporphyrinogen III oxidase